MVWDWNDDAAGPVHDMWGLMKQLSDCRDVVYSKWYQGRATFFSRDLFAAILCLRCRQFDARRRLSPTARILFEVLENNSPLSTRKLKELTELQGRLHEADYSRAMKELFSRFLIVGFGEVDDGACGGGLVAITREADGGEGARGVGLEEGFVDAARSWRHRPPGGPLRARFKTA
jgi:hypothetical protein